MAKKQRLDQVLVKRGLTESRSLAQRLIMAGQVRVDDQVQLKPSYGIPASAVIEIDHGPKYVSRGGEKLAAALEQFPIRIAGRVAADVGASTGGFTDCLLQHGATRVYAVDVGHGILHWKLRQDPRVIVMERTNARYLEALPEHVDIVTIDASFISLRLLLPVVRNWLCPSGELILLVKPQFEAGRKAVKRGGVVRDPVVHRSVLQGILEFSSGLALSPQGLIPSPLKGPKGNREFLLWLQPEGVRKEWNQWLDDLFEESGEEVS